MRTDSHVLIFNPLGNGEDCHGFSPEQMFVMNNYPFDELCPVQIRTLSEEEILRIPFMRQVLYLMRTLELGELKLTAQGYIPPRVVTELYEMGVRSWGSDWFKQHNEPKTEEVQVLRAALRESGLIKTRLGKMSLTAAGRKLLQDQNALMRYVLRWLFADYNVAWLDACDDERPGNIGRIYSLWLLHRFGGEWRHDTFYTAEYTKAFPIFDNYSGYSHRVFNRLFRLIGLCETSDRRDSGIDEWGHFIRKTDILEMLFSFVEAR